MVSKTRLDRLKREADKLAPDDALRFEPLPARWYDMATGELVEAGPDELALETKIAAQVSAGRASAGKLPALARGSHESE